MKLYWLPKYERIANDRLQEYYVEENNGFLMKGQIVVFCRNCKRWVSQHDYENYCKEGYHEYSNPIEINHENPLPAADRS